MTKTGEFSVQLASWVEKTTMEEMTKFMELIEDYYKESGKVFNKNEFIVMVLKVIKANIEYDLKKKGVTK